MTRLQEAQEAEHEGRCEEAAQIYKGLDLPEREDAMHLRAAERAEEGGGTRRPLRSTGGSISSIWNI
jgi:hypothetical protein